MNFRILCAVNRFQVAAAAAVVVPHNHLGVRIFPKKFHNVYSSVSKWMRIIWLGVCRFNADQLICCSFIEQHEEIDEISENDLKTFSIMPEKREKNIQQKCKCE